MGWCQGHPTAAVFVLSHQNTTAAVAAMPTRSAGAISVGRDTTRATAATDAKTNTKAGPARVAPVPSEHADHSSVATAGPPA